MKYNIDISLNKQQELTDLHSSSKSASIAASVGEQRVLCVIKILMAVLFNLVPRAFPIEIGRGGLFPPLPISMGKAPGTRLAFIEIILVQNPLFPLLRPNRKLAQSATQTEGGKPVEQLRLNAPSFHWLRFLVLSVNGRLPYNHGRGYWIPERGRDLL